MERSLDRSGAGDIVTVLRKLGYEAVFAGGCVRDMLLGLTPKDYDIATNATPDQIEGIFSKTLSIGKAFGVILVCLDGIFYEVATFRTDIKCSFELNTKLVNFSTMKEDAKRRDLTVNAMFYDPVTEEIIDYVGGQKDLKNKVIRFVGDPVRRIEEDKVRMLRAVRFSVALNFEIEPASLEAIRNNISKIDVVSKERIRLELLKMLILFKAKKVFNLMHNLGLLKILFPEIDRLKGTLQDEKHHPEGDVFTHTLEAMDSLPKDASYLLLLGTLFHDIGKPETYTKEDRIRFLGHESVGASMTERILQDLKFPNEETEIIKNHVKNHMKFHSVKIMRKAKLKRFLASKHFLDLLSLHKADCDSSAKDLDKYDYVIKKMNEYEFTNEKMNENVDLLPSRIVTGDDLIKIGFKPGKIFKEILLDVEDNVLEGTLSSKEEALEYILSKYKDRL